MTIYYAGKYSLHLHYAVGKKDGVWHMYMYRDILNLTHVSLHTVQTPQEGNLAAWSRTCITFEKVVQSWAQL